ncbi:hypothetical protein E2I00_009622 [Balaenoptera physalus]|uniref:Uncharacterized protein n=1 Tax=Balaenoptera physalus TaxID=9770 RepID=A0A643C3Z7_BALPH|nr:hypothetical protein E2I00_009622 [Balaenoptera physalus]
MLTAEDEHVKHGLSILKLLEAVQLPQKRQPEGHILEKSGKATSLPCREHRAIPGISWCWRTRFRGGRKHSLPEPKRQPQRLRRC